MIQVSTTRVSSNINMNKNLFKTYLKFFISKSGTNFFFIVNE